MPGYIQARQLLRSTISDICYDVSKHRTQVPVCYLTVVVQKICPGMEQKQLDQFIDKNVKNQIDIETFSSLLLKKCVEYNRIHLVEKQIPSRKQSYNFEEFRLTLITVYPFIEQMLVESKLRPIFKLIDIDNDGIITQQEMGRLYSYVATNDKSKSSDKTKFVFNDIKTARNIRTNLLKLLMKFDKNKDQKLNKEQVVSILTSILNDSSDQLDYSLAVIFQNDIDKLISFKDMIDFLLEKHCGQMSINRHESMNKYKFQKKKSMDFKEFVKTLDNALGYFYDNISQGQMQSLFDLIDTDKDGMINYQQYLNFLKQYFGSQSCLENTEIKINQQDANNKKNAMNLLSQALEQTSKEEEQNYKNMFKLLIEPESLNPQQHKKLTTFLRMSTTMLVKGHKTKSFKKCKQFLLSQKQFFDIVVDSTEWAELTMDTSALKFIFNQIDSNKDFFISYIQFIQFIKQAAGNRNSKQLSDYLALLFTEQEIQPNLTQTFKTIIWQKIKQIYYSHLGKTQTSLDISIVNKVISALLKQQVQQICYIRWNYSRIDRNNDLKVSLQQFTSFLISHAAETSLQHYHHVKKQKDNDSLSKEQFVSITLKTFNYIPGSTQWKQMLQSIYDNIKQQNTVSYKTYLAWVKQQLI